MRINLWGGPGSGKTWTAAAVAVGLRGLGYEVDLIEEKIKDWARRRIKPEGLDQLKFFSEQILAEELVLRHDPSGVVVTDSPVLMNVAYAEMRGVPIWPELLAIGKKFDKQHPCLNIWLMRHGVPYREYGRYQNRQEADGVDGKLLDFMARHRIKCGFANSINHGAIIEAAVAKIEGHESPELMNGILDVGFEQVVS